MRRIRLSRDGHVVWWPLDKRTRHGSIADFINEVAPASGYQAYLHGTLLEQSHTVGSLIRDGDFIEISEHPPVGKQKTRARNERRKRSRQMRNGAHDGTAQAESHNENGTNKSTNIEAGDSNDSSDSESSDSDSGSDSSSSSDSASDSSSDSDSSDSDSESSDSDSEQESPAAPRDKLILSAVECLDKHYEVGIPPYPYQHLPIKRTDTDGPFPLGVFDSLEPMPTIDVAPEDIVCIQLMLCEPPQFLPQQKSLVCRVVKLSTDSTGLTLQCRRFDERQLHADSEPEDLEGGRIDGRGIIELSSMDPGVVKVLPPYLFDEYRNLLDFADTD